MSSNGGEVRRFRGDGVADTAVELETAAVSQEDINNGGRESISARTRCARCSRRADNVEPGWSSLRSERGRHTAKLTCQVVSIELFRSKEDLLTRLALGRTDVDDPLPLHGDTSRG